MAVSFREHQAANRRKTWLLLVLMFVAVIAVIWAVGNLLGMNASWLVPVAVAISLIGVWLSYWNSDKLVLRMTGAHVISHEDAPQLYNVVEEVCLAAGLPMPKVAIVDDEAPNAFATGRDPEHAVIAFTTGILRVMDRDQLQGVAAHEMAHVGNRDTLVMAVAASTGDSGRVSRTSCWATASSADVTRRCMPNAGRHANARAIAVAPASARGRRRGDRSISAASGCSPCDGAAAPSSRSSHAVDPAFQSVISTWAWQSNANTAGKSR